MRIRRKLVVGLYVGMACLTLAFQTYVRLPQCTGTAGCTLSIGKGAIWSAAWPASWAVYASGWVNGGDAVPSANAAAVPNANVAVDAAWYFSQYPDVRAAVLDGRVKSAEEHYRTYGFKEKRLPAKPKFDEEYYLRANPDVAAAVRNGQFKSGFEHYVADGYREGRKALP